MNITRAHALKIAGHWLDHQSAEDFINALFGDDSADEKKLPCVHNAPGGVCYQSACPMPWEIPAPESWMPIAGPIILENEAPLLRTVLARLPEDDPLRDQVPPIIARIESHYEDASSIAESGSEAGEIAAELETWAAVRTLEYTTDPADFDTDKLARTALLTRAANALTTTQRLVDWYRRGYQSIRTMLDAYHEPTSTTNEKTTGEKPTTTTGIDTLDGAKAEIARLHHIIDSPDPHNFLLAADNEMRYQRVQWEKKGDAGKTDADWFWLIGYLAGKALHTPSDDPRKKLHRITTVAAAAGNWHAAHLHQTTMRPGTATPSGEIA